MSDLAWTSNCCFSRTKAQIVSKSARLFQNINVFASLYAVQQRDNKNMYPILSNSAISQDQRWSADRKNITIHQNRTSLDFRRPQVFSNHRNTPKAALVPRWPSN